MSSYDYVFPLFPEYRKDKSMMPPITPSRGTQAAPGMMPGMPPAAPPAGGMVPAMPMCPYMMSNIQMNMSMMQGMPMYQDMMPGMPMYQDMIPMMDLGFPEDEELMKTAKMDPPPVLSNNPSITFITLRNELTGYPNYGNPSKNADILYTGNTGAWTFQLPAIISFAVNLSGELIIRGVLDDHNNVPENRYSMTVRFNGTDVFSGEVPFVHGRPAGGVFTNWVPLTVNVLNFRRNNRIVICNTSKTGNNDWIGIDWMELGINQR